jgi:hypothetical protein
MLVSQVPSRAIIIIANLGFEFLRNFSFSLLITRILCAAGKSVRTTYRLMCCFCSAPCLLFHSLTLTLNRSNKYWFTFWENFLIDADHRKYIFLFVVAILERKILISLHSSANKFFCGFLIFGFSTHLRQFFSINSQYILLFATDWTFIYYSFHVRLTFAIKK